MTKRAILMYDTARNADFIYGSGFMVHDPVIFIDNFDKKYLVLNSLEIDRGKKEANVDEILAISKYSQNLDNSKDKMFQIMDLVLKDLNIKKIQISDSFSAFYYKELVDHGYDVKIIKGSSYPNRIYKSEDEKNKIKDVMKELDKALRVVTKILTDATIDGEFIKYKDKHLTSEYIKEVINIELLRKNIFSESIIVASGNQTIDPHNIGSGKLYANTPIIIDIFPRSNDSLYFGDQTRTFIKGKATDEQKKLYNTVLEGQKLGISMLKEGVNGMDIHNSIMEYFNSKGFKTGIIDGRNQGFFHGTGHGVGLEIHESPRVSGQVDAIMKAGYVVTIEPGLYYKDLGGVRVEDTLWVTKDGCENLSFSDKFFEIL